MNDHTKEIDRIIREGVKKNLDSKQIVDQILALTTEARKHEDIPIKEYEEIISKGKQRIRELRRLLITSLSGSNH